MNVALLGFGTVGSKVYELIKAEDLDIQVKSILVKHRDKHSSIQVLLAHSFDDIILDDSIDVVIETIGGTTDAYAYVKKALEHKKHVVTANKALMSTYFRELHELAKNNQVQLRFEASVGGSMICVDPIIELSKFNHIYKIEGILNGSTNYLLSQIFDQDKTLEEALVEAKSLGYLEQDPKDDLEGFDLMYKIHILSMIAYQRDIDVNQIMRIPLTNITQDEINQVKRNHQIMKYIASSELVDDKPFIKVEPKVIESSHPYAKIQKAMNIINIYGKYNQYQSFARHGAGGLPTASAIVYDLLKIKELNHI